MVGYYETERLTGVAGRARAVELIEQGECVALPTETVYGLAADASNPTATAKTFAAKQRPLDHPLIVHLPSVDHAHHWAAELPDSLFLLAEAFWPGPLTVLLPKRADIGDHITAGQTSVALRVPAHSDFQYVLSAVNRGMTAPSANPYKRLSPTTADHVLGAMRGRIAAVFDGGPCRLGLESTIIDLRTEALQVLRAGPINATDIGKVLKRDVVVPLSHEQVVPGNVKAHYQPVAPTESMSLEQWRAMRFSDQEQRAYVLYSDAMQHAVMLDDTTSEVIKLPENADGYAQKFYAALHQLDAQGCQRIIVETPPKGIAWLAIHDRLARACYR